jgi:hypothetical protein
MNSLTNPHKFNVKTHDYEFDVWGLARAYKYIYGLVNHNKPSLNLNEDIQNKLSAGDWALWTNKSSPLVLLIKAHSRYKGITLKVYNLLKTWEREGK